ncbi:MAG: hypothetical protein AB7V48_07120 [Sedimentibacter sp.]
MIRTLKKLVILTLLLFTLTGCVNRDEISLYLNKEQTESEIEKLEKEKNQNNGEVNRVFKSYNTNKNAAIRFEEDILPYLKDLNLIKFDIGRRSIKSESFLQYNLIVFKTQLLVDIENAVNEELLQLQSYSNIAAKEAEERAVEQIFNSIEIDYFLDSDTGHVEQMIMYKNKDGSNRIISLTWRYGSCSKTNILTSGEA